MLKCPIDGCKVVVAKGVKSITPQQRGALGRHLAGRISSVRGEQGHGIEDRGRRRRLIEIAVRGAR